MSDQVSHSKTRKLRDYFLNRRCEILALTRALVESESPSGDEAGSRTVVSLLAASLRSVGGITAIERIPAERYGEHLRMHAFGSGRNSSKTILILGHTDTVHPTGSLRSRPWRIEGNCAYGPGIFDMKANCALAMESIRACATLSIAPQRPVVLLFTCDEERGSARGRALVESEAEQSQAVLVLEPPASGGRVKTGRKGTGMFTLEARGRAAHAGLEPEKGASAVLEMARQIQRLHEMNNSGGGISVNVGVVHGGTVSNVVPAEACAEIDVRFETDDEGKRIEQLLLGLQPFDSRVALSMRGEINRPPLER